MAVSPLGLLPWQPKAADQILAALGKHRGALDLSDMGTGKTGTAVAVIRHEDLPTAVICPSVAVSSWRAMGDRLNTKFSIQSYEMIRSGKTPFGRWENPPPKKRESQFRCDVCQQKFDEKDFPFKPCPHHFLGVHCIHVEPKPHSYGKFLWNDGIKRLWFDEVHRCSGIGSLQEHLLCAGRRQGIPTVGLSATAAEDPLGMRGIGFSIGLHNYLNFYGWVQKYGCRKAPWGGFAFMVGEQRKREIMAELHHEIIPDRGTRVRIADLGDMFPKMQLRAELYDLDEGGRIDELYAEMEEALGTMGQGGNLAVHAAQRAHQEVELLTVPLFVELVRDANAQGKHCAIFVNFRKTVEELCKRLKTSCRVDGSQVGPGGARRRDDCIARFQDDSEPNIVCSNAAGGIAISLHDLHGRFGRLGLISPGFDAKGFRQVTGRLRRAGGKSEALYRVVLVKGTRHEKIHKALSSKLDCLDALNDADLNPCNLPLTSHLLSNIYNPQAI